jgi:hypothetical protein
MTSEAPTNPPQRARLCAQITGAGRDAAEVNSRRRAIKQREKSGLAPQQRAAPQKIAATTLVFHDAFRDTARYQ